MTSIRLVRHATGAPGLRWLGLGPNLMPNQGLLKLQRLFNQHAFWATGRSTKDLRQALRGSQAVVSLWCGGRLVGFGRATSDGVYRAVLWDVVVASDVRGQGFGRLIIDALIKTDCVHKAEKIYLMTTNSSGFYLQLGFEVTTPQKTLVMDQINRTRKS